MTKLTVVFRNFANAPENYTIIGNPFSKTNVRIHSSNWDVVTSLVNVATHKRGEVGGGGGYLMNYAKFNKLNNICVIQRTTSH
jgi:predicted ATP-grasp superfamily ATP-dependent carboligase